ncbi:MAG: hypothetical protein ACD_50C00344G0006 [uncultured bacterium]|nr:MAG: hypothetical protein ACD_50C00344G0006 [uncultured bacterium]OGH13249.1 MAG: hypothetical protein A2687_03850 [Candidatus Levybacteria bacterium RIFCSPHIGHO2_01_FULL_38_26]
MEDEQKVNQSEIVSLPYSDQNQGNTPDIRLKKEETLFTQSLERAMTASRNSGEFTEKKDLQMWNDLNENIFTFVNIHIPAYKQIDEAAGEENDSMYAHAFKDAVYQARNLIIINTLLNQRKLAQKNGFLEQSEPFFTLNRFYLAGDMDVKIAGLSIYDIATNLKINPSDYYRSVMTSYSTLEKPGFEDITNENTENIPVETYPNMANKRISIALNSMLTMGILAEECNYLFSASEERGRASKAFTHSADKLHNGGKLITNGFVRQREKALRTLLDPSSEHFEALRELVEKDLTQDEESDKIAYSLSILGLNHIDNIPFAYRKAKELEEKSGDTKSFYALLAKSILEEEGQLLTHDDIPLFIDLEKSIENQKIPSLEDIERINKLYFPKTSQRDFNVNMEDVKLGKMVPPNSIRVEFPKGHSGIFNIYFDYENDQGESTTLEFNFDTRKNMFDWKPFIEATNDPEMASLRKSALIASYSILSQIQKQVEEEYQQKQQQRLTRTQMPQHTSKQSHSKEPYVPRLREKRPERPRPLFPIQEILQGKVSLPLHPEQSRVKNQIVLNDDQGINKTAGNLSNHDRHLVAKAIEEYNQKGIGQFKKLTYTGGEKTPLFTLRVNTGSGGGGVRVLMREAPDIHKEENTRSFEVIDIDYRKNIYRGKNLRGARGRFGFH